MKSTEHNTEPLNPWGWQTGAQFSRKLQVMVHCPAAVSTIYPVWQLPALYPVIGEACTLFFHLWHYHYVRWASVHLRDMMTVSHLHPTCKQDSWSDTSRSRRRVMCFQAWQHNAVVKEDGGGGGLTECSWRGGCSADQIWHVSLLTLKDESIAQCTGVQKIVM